MIAVLINVFGVTCREKIRRQADTDAVSDYWISIGVNDVHDDLWRHPRIRRPREQP